MNNQALLATAIQQKKIILLFLALCISCQACSNNQFSQKEKLELAVGNLSLEYMKTFSYQNGYQGIHMAKTSGAFYDIYEKHVKYLDEKYRVQYYLSAFWIIPFSGGEIAMLTETIANDSCRDKFIEALDSFIESEEKKSYQPEKYQFAILIKNEIKKIPHN